MHGRANTSAVPIAVFPTPRSGSSIQLNTLAASVARFAVARSTPGRAISIFSTGKSKRRSRPCSGKGGGDSAPLLPAVKRAADFRSRAGDGLYHLICKDMAHSERIRTPDPRNRNPMLYPAELRVSCGSPISRLGRPGPAPRQSEAGVPTAVLADIGGGALVAAARGRAVVKGKGAGQQPGAVTVQIADRVGQRKR